jgi:hypothetical protein
MISLPPIEDFQYRPSSGLLLPREDRRRIVRAVRSIDASGDPADLAPRRRAPSRRNQRGMISPGLLGVVAARARTGGSGSNDPLFSDVLLLLHGEGTHGSTTFTDSSTYAHTLSILHGSPTITTSQSQIGSASLNFPGGAVLGNSSASDDWRTDNPPGSGNWGGAALPICVDFWVRRTGTSDPQFMVDNRQLDNSGVTAWAIAYESGKWGFYAGGGFTYSSGAAALNTWTHVAVSRAAASAVWRFYVGGVQQGTVSSNLGDGYVRVGGRGAGDYTFTGQMDAVRWTRADRYPGGTTFTPPVLADY